METGQCVARNINKKTDRVCHIAAESNLFEPARFEKIVFLHAYTSAANCILPYVSPLSKFQYLIFNPGVKNISDNNG